MLETLFAGKFISMVRRDGWEYVRRAGGATPVGIVAVTAEKKLLLVEQMRIPVEKPCIELPAGLVGDVVSGESFEAAAIRELEEETGYRAKRIEFLTEGPTSAGLTDEQIKLVRAHELEKIGPGGGDATERIAIHEIAVAEVPAFLARSSKKGFPVDPKVYAALYFLSR
jgi:ADP-ribose pyrophosphatase